MKIKLVSIADMYAVTALATQKGCLCTLKQGRYIVNCASILGLCSLNLLEPVELVVENGDYSGFEQYAI